MTDTPRSPRPLRVVLVDDIDDVRRVVRTALRLRGGFEVVGEASDGVAGVRLAGEAQPDLVVLDLGLPDLAGRDVLTGIRGASPGSKIVIFSGEEPTDPGSIAEQVEGFVRKDREMSHLVDVLESVGKQITEEFSIELEHDPRSVPRARAFVRDVLRKTGAHALYDDAALLVSELVTNAITHANSGCRLHLSLTPSVLRLAVIDEGDGTPEPQIHDESMEHGRGLHLVGAIASAWGIDTWADVGKIVWAELPRTAQASA